MAFQRQYHHWQSCDTCRFFCQFLFQSGLREACGIGAQQGPLSYRGQEVQGVGKQRGGDLKVWIVQLCSKESLNYM